MPIEPRDAGAVEDLYDAYGASCYRLAHRMVADEQLAGTIVRDLFVAVWSGEAVCDLARGSIYIWLLRATRSRAVSVLRRQRQLASDVTDTDLLRGPQTLEAVLRQVLELAYFGGYTDSEIATRTGTTPRMVKTLKVQALRGVGTRRPTPAPSRGLSVRNS
ncbi:MAG TPA: sigma factor-like helix-turn-helix DNA-binding protein [Acidothermaceae bacterium]